MIASDGKETDEVEHVRDVEEAEQTRDAGECAMSDAGGRQKYSW